MSTILEVELFDLRHPAESDTCFIVETVEAIVSSQSGLTNPLEASLV